MTSLTTKLKPIAENEVLYRSVLPRLDFWESDTNEITSAVFKDPNGLSTDRSDGRSEEVCVNFLDSRQTRCGGVVSVNVTTCTEKDIYLKPDPIPNGGILPENPFHTLVLRSCEIFVLTKSQAKHLARNAKIIRWGLVPTI